MSHPDEASHRSTPAAAGPFPADTRSRPAGPRAQLRTPGQGGRPAPNYATDEFVQLLHPTVAPKARRGWRALLGLGPSQRELLESAQLDAVRVQFQRPVTLMVANPKGGTGKTPISLLLAGEFGDARGGGVVVVDNNENRGTAAFRSYFPHRRTVADLLEAADRLEGPEAQFTDLAFFLAHQTSGKYYVLASDESVTRQLDAKVFARVHRILSRFFGIIIIDSGNNEMASNWLAALDVADGLVVPTQWRQDHIVTANKMLETLRNRQHPIVQRAMIVGTNAPAAAQKEPKRAALEWFEGRHHLPVVEIPTDRHIHEGGILDRAQMGKKTRQAGLAAAAVVSGLIQVVAGRTQAEQRVGPAPDQTGPQPSPPHQNSPLPDTRP